MYDSLFDYRDVPDDLREYFEEVETQCGAPWARVVEREQAPAEVFTRRTRPDDGFIGGMTVDGVKRGSGQKLQAWRDEHPPGTRGFRPTCGCGAPAVGAVVLDPFVGSGTTVLQALRMGRRAIGFDASAVYVSMARERVVGDAPLLNRFS